MIGKKATKKDLESARDRGTDIVDYKRNRIICLTDFFTGAKEKASLKWGELVYIKNRCDGGSVVLPRKKKFDDILNGLLEELTKRGLMTRGTQPREGDFCFMYIGGITVFNDTVNTETYFPRKLEDAVEYAHEFFKNAIYPVYYAQVKGVANRNWNIRREK